MEKASFSTFMETVTKGSSRTTLFKARAFITTMMEIAMKESSGTRRNMVRAFTISRQVNDMKARFGMTASMGEEKFTIRMEHTRWKCGKWARRRTET